jgi:hypothetical protein
MAIRYAVALVGTFLACSVAIQAAGEELKITIVTEIRDVSTLSVQVGMKSTQMLTLTTENNSISSDFKTGVTDILVADLPSVRDGFTVGTPTLNGSIVVLSAKGQTASFLSVMGDIDYDFTLRINTDQRKVWISGCHNEFPSYSVTINGGKVYDRQQTGSALTGLIGDCDVLVNEDAKPFP